MAEDDDLLPISALQHMIFCPRQAALIHVERIWLDNARTLEGSDLHAMVDSMERETRGDLVVHRGISLRSDRLGLVGKSDVVEFHRTATDSPREGCSLSGHPGLWRPYPVEYKRGRPKEHRADEVQLCAQGMCLEDALGTPVPLGALYYGETHHRLDVPLDQELRELTEQTAVRLREMVGSRVTPGAWWQKKCGACSLQPVCLPPRKARGSARAYVERMIEDARFETDGEGV